MYLLVDANMVMGYYLPHSLTSVKARERIRSLIDSIRLGEANHFLYVPNFCIAEVFSGFAKYSYGRYNQQVRKKGGTIDTRIYKSICDQFHMDIHNGKVFYQLELNRYHILGIDLVSPIDHHFKIRRSDKFLKPSGTFDQLIVSMLIHLVHIHGQENVALITADNRLSDLVNKCRSNISDKTIEKLGLNRAQDVAGKKFSEKLFPEVINLGKITDEKLIEFFGAWPISEKVAKNVNRYEK